MKVQSDGSHQPRVRGVNRDEAHRHAGRRGPYPLREGSPLTLEMERTVDSYDSVSLSQGSD